MSYKFLKVLDKLKLCTNQTWFFSPLILDEWRAEVMGSTVPARLRTSKSKKRR